ncbi:Component of the SF3b subcomplex of the U2 snRNP [Parahypoxylon ruwenzoriense]
MPAIRSHASSSSRQKKPPAGFDDIRDDLEVFAIKMKDAQNAPTNNVPKHQAQWPIFQIAHQRSRYVYELYYEKEAITRQLYDWLLKNGYADPMLIAKWKKQGYEKLCCLRCIQTKETNFQSTCICRVPKAQLKDEQDVQCVSCGCRGCASSD